MGKIGKHNQTGKSVSPVQKYLELQNEIIIEVCCQNGGMHGMSFSRSQYALQFSLVTWVAEYGIYLSNLEMTCN